jgi:hypothetical protein
VGTPERARKVQTYAILAILDGARWRLGDSLTKIELK